MIIVKAARCQRDPLNRLIIGHEDRSVWKLAGEADHRGNYSDFRKSKI
jgi:hypothetical protein